MELALGYKATLADADLGGLTVKNPRGHLLPPLPGRVLEAAFADARDELLFISYDILYEEQLDIVLLREREVVDRLALGQMFQPGDLGNLHQLAPRRFTFTFPADQGWQLEVSERPRFSWSGLRRSISRPQMWRSYLTLKPDALTRSTSS